MAELSGRVKQPMPRCLGQAGRSGPLQGRRNKMGFPWPQRGTRCKMLWRIGSWAGGACGTG